MPDSAHVDLHKVTRDGASQASDRLVFKCILEKALVERDILGGSLAKRVGIGGTALGILLMLHVPGHPVLPPQEYVEEDVCEEQAWVRDLLLSGLSTDLTISRWLAAIIARRSMEAKHLYEDLGFLDRSLLSLVMRTHFSALAQRNVDDMRWKKFFYRMMCEEDGFSQCTSPTCGHCPDVDKCFEPASAEAMIARSKGISV